jgi:hypothetical protein
MSKKAEKKSSSGLVTGLILLGLGIIFQLNSFNIVDIEESWPVIIIVIGLALIAGSIRGGSAVGRRES